MTLVTLVTLPQKPPPPVTLVTLVTLPQKSPPPVTLVTLVTLPQKVLAPVTLVTLPRRATGRPTRSIIPGSGVRGPGLFAWACVSRPGRVCLTQRSHPLTPPAGCRPAPARRPRCCKDEPQ